MRKSHIVILSGLAVRLILAPATGHPYDMGLFAFGQRMYFEQGIVGLKVFPAPPILYFVQLPFYSLYALLVTLGLSDYQLLYHTSLMIESIFLKFPYMLADLGTFFLLQRITGRLWPATLFFLNPLIILESSVWGIYDSLMLVALVYGLFRFQKGDATMSSVSFLIAGALKLFGFLPYIALLAETALRKNLKIVKWQILGGVVVIAAIIGPIVLVGAFYLFLTGFVFRFIGLSGLTTGSGRSVVGVGTAYSILYLLFPSFLTKIPSPTLLIVLIVSFLYIIEARKGSGSIALIKWTLIGAILLNIFSQAEPQWLAWTVPLAITYGSLTRRTGLQIYTYIYGAASAFLINTQSQSGGYEILGTKTFVLPFIEGYPNLLFVYAMTTFVLLLLMLVYTFHKPVKFRLEVILFVVLAYLQVYFWFSIVNIPRILGVA